MTTNSDIISIRSNEELNRLERFIEEILDYYNIPGEYFGNIFLAVTEAVQLSLKNEGEVTVEMKKSRKGVSFSITQHKATDQELDELDRAIAKHTFARETFIIRSLADEAELLRDGKTIVLRFHITGINLERSLLRSEKLKSYLTRKEKVVDTNE
ncbi:MAG: hypothetical protein IH596_04505 [Bacteroidales bacterium]|nr:hypothetical protein [Bacteroidales bacterium]